MTLYHIKKSNKHRPEYRYYATEEGKVFVDKGNGIKEVSYINCGYKSSYIGVNIDNKRIYLHRVIYSCFIGKIPNDKEIDHIDGDKHNNNISNLRCVYPHENASHRSTLGSHGQGITKTKIEVTNPYGGVTIVVGVDKASEASGCAIQTIRGALCYGNKPKGYTFTKLGNVTHSITNSYGRSGV